MNQSPASPGRSRRPPIKQFVRRGQTYDNVVSGFRWDLPSRFNLGVACTDAQDPAAVALTHVEQGGTRRSYKFGELSRLSNRMANCLSGLGLARGDRVAINLSQCPEFAIAIIGVFKAQLMAVPLSTLFGPEAVRFRLADSAARVLVTTESNLARLEPILADLPSLESVLVVGNDPRRGAVDPLLLGIAGGGVA